MFKITKLTTWLMVCCLLLGLVSQAQTGNPYLAFPPNDIHVTTSGLGPLNALTTNSYTWTQSGYTVQPGYLGNPMTDWGANTINGPSNMVTDASGNPLFSVISGYVFNPHGFLIDTLIDSVYLNDLGNKSYWRGVSYGHSEVCVVPNPNNCQQYYVFTCMPIPINTGVLGNTLWYQGNNCTSGGIVVNEFEKPYFTCIDVSQSGQYMPLTEYGKNMKSAALGVVGNGTVADLYKVTSTPNIGGGSCRPFNGDIHYATTKVYNKGGAVPYRLVFLVNDDEIITYKVTGTTVSTNSTGVQWVSTNELSGITSGFAGNNTAFVNVSELEIYQDTVNSKIKVAFSAPNAAGYATNVNFLCLMNFDTLGNYLTGTSHVTYTNTAGASQFYVKGIEFSPNGNYVYVAHDSTSNYPSSIDQLTYSTGAPSYTLSTHPAYQYSQIEKGVDGNLYLIASTGTASPTMAKIGSPNSATPTLTPNVLTLTGYTSNTIGGYITSPIYTIPDQIDQEVYSNLYNNPTLQCCLLTEPYDKTIYDVGTSPPTSTWTNTATTQTWSANTGTTTATCKNPIALQTNTTSTVTIGSELRIPAGYTITINNMTIKFSPQARLIIENGTSSLAGGKLVLSGCTLTVDNVCGLNDMWPGVQVWGTPASAQTGTYQGFLQMSGSTVIENAYVAVLAGYDSTWLSNVTPRPLYYTVVPSGHGFNQSNSWNNGANSGAGGGIVQGIGTTFLNNQRAAVYVPYTHTAGAGQKLQTCTFSVNAALLNTSVAPRYFVGLYGVTNNFAINGCSFTDSHNLNADTGLYTSNSTAWVDEYLTTRSFFTTLRYGIYAYNTGGSTAFIHCKNSTFNNNWFGIYLGYINNAIVETDTFRLLSTTCVSHCSRPLTYGLYIDNGTAFSVRDNYFTKYGVGTPTNTLYGIIANNTGANTNIIFRNTFTGVTYGNQAQFINFVYNSTSPNNSPGLQYICNIFTPSSIYGRDIYVPSNTSGNNLGTGSTTYSAGIAYTQGTGSNSGYPSTGGNQFSHTTGGNDFYIDAASYNSNYIYYCLSSCPPSSSVWYPNPVNNLTVSSFTSNVDCSSNPYTCSGCRTSDPMQNMLNQANAYKAICDSITGVIDGGNTSSLLSLINGNNNSNAVYNSLNNVAPYISDNVLKAYINSNYPTNDITQLLSNCSPLTDEVKKAVNASNFSTGIKSQLNSSQSGSSKVFNMNVNKGNALSSRHQILDDLIRTYISDTVPANVQKGYALMKVKALDLPAKAQVQTGIDLHDSAMAATALTQVANEEGQSNFVKLHTILLQNINLSAHQLMKNSSVLNGVKTLAADSSDRLTYLKANTLLQTVGLSKYIPYIQEDQTTVGQSAREAATAVEAVTTINSQSTLFNSPNPFKESTTVKAVIVEKTQNAFIVITDMVGNEVARYPVQQGENNINISAGGLNQAVMFCTLVVDGVKIKTNKMVLIK